MIYMVCTNSRNSLIRGYYTCGLHRTNSYVKPMPHSHMRCEILTSLDQLTRSLQKFSIYSCDYWLFFKQIESIPLQEVKATNVVTFIKYYVIYHFGIFRQIVHENGPQFISQVFYWQCDKIRIQSIASTACNHAINGLVEGFNKTIIKLLKKVLHFNKHNWDQNLGK